jgi:hypothetical protein
VISTPSSGTEWLFELSLVNAFKTWGGCASRINSLKSEIGLEVIADKDMSKDKVVWPPGCFDKLFSGGRLQ